MNRHFNLAALFAGSIGILGAAYLSISAKLYFGLFLGLICLILVRLICNKDFWSGLVLLACCLWLAGWFSINRESYRTELCFNQKFNQQQVVLEGIQLTRPVATRNGISFTYQIQKSSGPQGKIMVFCPQKDRGYWYGKRLRLIGKFKSEELKKNALPDYYEAQGLTGVIFLSSQPELIEGNGLPRFFLWADQLRQSLIKQGAKVLKRENLELLHGMLFGDRLSGNETIGRFINELRRTGTIHLLSVSGLHVGLIIFSLLWLLKKLGLPEKYRLIPLVPVMLLYIMMTGMGIPVLRSGLMLLAYLVAENLNAQDPPLNRLSFAALLLLLIRPNSLFELSFQLSILATWGILVIYPALNELFPVKKSWLQPIWKGFLISSAAQLAILPLLVNYFQQIAWSSPLVNLLLMIPAEIVVVGGLCGEILGCLLPWLGWIILKLVDFNLNLIRFIVHLIGTQNWAAGYSPAWNWCWISGYYLSLYLLYQALRPNLINPKVRDWGLVMIIFLIMGNLLLWLQLPPVLAEPALKITLFDVGQGDAILVESPDKVRILIDGGDYGAGKSEILPYLRKQGINHLELVIATHGHQDHLGGLSEVLTEIPTEKLLMPAPRTEDAKHFLRKIKSLGVKATFCSKLKFRLGEQIIAELWSLPEATDENDRSLVLSLSYGKNSVLLTGDLTEQGEAILCQSHPEFRQFAILKVGHHGSSYSSSVPFLTQIRPRLSLISVGQHNRYGHPGLATLQRLSSLGSEPYRTDQQGQLELLLYPERIAIKGEKK